MSTHWCFAETARAALQTSSRDHAHAVLRADAAGARPAYVAADQHVRRRSRHRLRLRVDVAFRQGLPPALWSITATRPHVELGRKRLERNAAGKPGAIGSVTDTAPAMVV